MKLIESSVEIIPQDIGLEGVYKQIERAGRVCYKSEDKICEGSAKKMVDFFSWEASWQSSRTWYCVFKSIS